MNNQKFKYPTRFSRVFFFIGVFINASFAAKDIAVIALSSYAIMSIGLASEMAGNKHNKRLIIFVKLIVVAACVCLASRNIAYLVVACLLYRRVIDDDDEMIELLYRAALTYIFVIISIGELSFFGGGLLIYYWGLPLIPLIIIYYVLLSGWRIALTFTLTIISVLLLIGEAYKSESRSVAFVVSNNDYSNMLFGNIDNVLANIGSVKGEQITINEFIASVRKGEDKSYVISLAVTPDVSSDWVRKYAKKGSYYFFGEHGNLNGFTKNNSSFNNDEFKRKGPWNSHRPVMAYCLDLSSEKDPLYCSNIGCTIKGEWAFTPLIWDYNNIGIPILLGIKEHKQNADIYMLGDSDPIVGFLAEYNKSFLAGLLGRHSRMHLMLFSLLLLVSLPQQIYVRRGAWYIVIVSLLVHLYLLGDWQQSDNVMVNIRVASTGDWLNPHYDNHYSSLPKKLVQSGQSVGIGGGDVSAAESIDIITKKKYHLSTQYYKGVKHAYVILLPGTSVIIDNNIKVASGDLPQGRLSLTNENKTISWDDGRTLRKNCDSLEYRYIRLRNVYIISSGNPSTLTGL